MAFAEIARLLHQPMTAPGGQVSGTELAAMDLLDLSASATLLTESDAQNLNGLARHEVTHNTIRSYRSQWRGFVTWATNRRTPPLPAQPEQVAAYLAERFEQHGHKPATLRVAAAAIAYVHSSCGLPNPCSHPDVKRTLRGATRVAGKAQKQAKGLTADALDAIEATACRRRHGKNGRRESAHTAARRGSVDIALVRLMRDALLRVSECAALTWSDIDTVPDGSGRLLIRRSKTDPDGEGAVLFVSPQTMTALASIRNGAPAELRVFGLSPNQISLRIKKAAVAAGLGDGFSGHSPRVGMAQDLARIGVELPSLMTAGRWRSPTMPAHYTRNETADRGAVAQFYNHLRGSRRAPRTA
jgi:integrase